MDQEQPARVGLHHTDVRRRLEETEERYLSPLAARSAAAVRDRDEEPSPLRTAFQRDRDRIVHSKAFRRLKHKTQVFIAPEGDHYRTRLTHTLEVTQVARTIGRALRLNEDLIEAIGVGHDLGHAPFGHAGEAALSRAHGHGFRHNEQSRRIVEILEPEGTGLNLTYDVREGVYMHSKVRKDISARGWGVASTLEGQIIKLADSIAYVNHDIDDAIRAGLLREDDLPADLIALLGNTHGKRINTMVCDMIDHNWWATGEATPPDPPLVSMSPTILEATNALRDFMFRNVYLADPVNADTEQVRFVIEHLYQHFVTHPEEIPAALRNIAAERNEPIERAALDQVAGMTDRYALKCFDAIYVPHS